jgi:Xaa-Pro aminopeptidase
VPWEKVWGASKAGRLPFSTIVKDIEGDIPTLITRREQVEAQAAIERQRREAEERERQQQERERQWAEAQEHSHDQLLEIVEGWSLALSIEAFFEDALRRSKDLDAEHFAAIKDRLAKARAMLGGLDALARFRHWKTPEELLALDQSA